jgi:5-methylcytosine-specific restriction protein A
MSLAIDVKLVTDVLLGDGWHRCVERTFTLDSYEFLYWSDDVEWLPGNETWPIEKGTQHSADNEHLLVLQAGGKNGITAIGFTFQETSGEWLFGPLTSILAVKAYGDHQEAKRAQGIPDIRWQVWERDNFTCRKCGSRQNLTVDHIVPKSKGGSDRLSNYQTLCAKCNTSKGARPITVSTNGQRRA